MKHPQHSDENGYFEQYLLNIANVVEQDTDPESRIVTFEEGVQEKERLKQLAQDRLPEQIKWNAASHEDLPDPNFYDVMEEDAEENIHAMDEDGSLVPDTRYEPAPAVGREIDVNYLNIKHHKLLVSLYLTQLKIQFLILPRPVISNCNHGPACEEDAETLTHDEKAIIRAQQIEHLEDILFQISAIAAYKDLGIPIFEAAWKDFDEVKDTSSNKEFREFLKRIEYHSFCTTQDLSVNFSKVSRVVLCADMLLKSLKDIKSSTKKNQAIGWKNKGRNAELLIWVKAWNDLQNCIQKETRFNSCALILSAAGVVDDNMACITIPHSQQDISFYEAVYNQAVCMEDTLHFIIKWLPDMTEVLFYHIDNTRFASITKSSVGLYDICNAPERIRKLE